MAKLPTMEGLGERPAPQPSAAVVSYNPATGAETAPGAAMAQLGETGMAEANTLFALMKQEQEKTDTIKVEDAWNQYKNSAIDLTYGETGLLKKEGADAVNGNLLTTATTSLRDQRNRIAQSLANDEQRARFLQRADITDLQTKQSVLSHLATQQKQYAKTTFEGSTATARAMVSKDPLSEETYLQSRDVLMRQADDYLNINGIRDKGVRDDLRAKLTDNLLATRIEGLLSMNLPLDAEQLFKKVAGDIQNPEIRMTYRNRVRQAAIPANASISASRVFDTVIEQDNQRRRDTPPISSRTTPEAGPVQPGALFDTAVSSLLRREGGYVASDGTSGAPANFGINQRANPDVDVKGLTRDKAVAIYRERYWDKIGGDNLAPATALVALDAAALQGVETAKKLIEETGGDPQAMIAKRREQLQALAARDPKQRPYLTGWMNRLASLEAEAATLPQGSYQTVSMRDDPLTQDTSGLPNSRDISALLPVMLSKVETTADELYGKDRTNPDRIAFVKQMTNEIQERVRDTVQQFNAIQRQVQGEMIDAITGARINGQPAPAGMMGTAQPQGGIRTVSQIMSNPQLRAAWDKLDPGVKPAMLNLIDRTNNQTMQGDERLFRELWNRIHLDPSDPAKIYAYQQIVRPEIANRMTMQQIQQLRTELDRAETPGGQSLNQLKKYADQRVEQYFKTHIQFTAQPDRAIAAINRWNEDLGRKIDEYVKAGKTEAEIRALFAADKPNGEPGSPESMMSKRMLDTYVTTTPAAGLASQAAQVKAGQPPIAQQQFTPEQIATLPQLPATIKTRADAEAWVQSLPPEIKAFRDTDGKPKYIPGRGPGPADVKPGTQATTTAAPAVAAAATPGIAPSMVEPDQQGKKVKPTEPLVADSFAVVARPSTVAGNVAVMRRARERAMELRKEAATGPQFDVTGPLVSIARGATRVGEAMLDLPGGVGRAAQRVIPTELEAIYNGWEAIKKAKRISMQDEDIISQVVRYGLLSAEDEKLAKDLLTKIEKNR